MLILSKSAERFFTETKTTIWLYGELIVLLTNKRKRAIHDFIAGTVIVKAKYIDRIREVMQDDIAEGNTPSELPGEGIAE